MPLAPEGMPNVSWMHSWLPSGAHAWGQGAFVPPHGMSNITDSCVGGGKDPSNWTCAIISAPFKAFPTALASWMRRGYMAAVSQMDANVGRILTKLRELNMEASTIVAFTSDHGWVSGLARHRPVPKMHTNFDLLLAP